jgi:hypothetical protein
MRDCVGTSKTGTQTYYVINYVNRWQRVCVDGGVRRLRNLYVGIGKVL